MNAFNKIITTAIYDHYRVPASVPNFVYAFIIFIPIILIRKIKLKGV